MDIGAGFRRQPYIIYKQLRSYVLAMLLTEAALAVNEVVIGMVVSNVLGAASLSAIASSLPVYGGCCAGAAFLGAGGSLLYGKALGQMKQMKAQRIFSTVIFLSVLTGMAAMAFGVVFLQKISWGLASGDAGNAEQLYRYLYYLMPGTPLIFLLSILAKFLTQAGSPSLAARLLILANIGSVLGSYALLVFGGMGVEGAALAIDISYAAALLVFAFLMVRKRISLQFVRIGWQDFRALWDGIPAGLSAGSMFFWFFLQVYGMNRLAYMAAGMDGLAIHGVCLGLNSLQSVISYAVMDAMLPMLAVMEGTNDANAQRFVLRRSYGILFVITAGISLLAAAFPDAVFALYGLHDVSLYAPGRTALRFYSVGICAIVWIICMQMHLAFVKHNVFSNLVSFIKSIAIVIPLGSVLIPVYGLDGLWAAYMMDGVLTLMLVFGFNVWQSYKSAGRLQGLLMLPNPQHQTMLDFTVNCSSGEAIAALSQHVIQQTAEFVSEDKLRQYIGLAVEEMGVLLQGQNPGQPHTLDVMIYREDDGVRVVFRDLGAPLNAMEQSEDNVEQSNVRMLRMIAAQVSYERILMMNQHTFWLQGKMKEVSVEMEAGMGEVVME